MAHVSHIWPPACSVCHVDHVWGPAAEVWWLLISNPNSGGPRDGMFASLRHYPIIYHPDICTLLEWELLWSTLFSLTAFAECVTNVLNYSLQSYYQLVVLPHRKSIFVVVSWAFAVEKMTPTMIKYYGTLHQSTCTVCLQRQRLWCTLTLRMGSRNMCDVPWHFEEHE